MPRACVLDFRGNWDMYLPLAEFAYNNSYHSSIQIAPYEALYGKKCRCPLYWTELNERRMYGPNLVDQTSKQIGIIRQRLLTTQSRQKSYVDIRRKPLEFEARDHVFLKVSPTIGVSRSIKTKMLNLKHIKPFQILLKKYHLDPVHIVEYDDITLQDNLSFKVGPDRIIDRKVKQLRNKQIPLVKVVWEELSIEEATWEVEEDMKEKYPKLFDK
ncbi:uncharacterized protein LOC114716129, partial [Neltuma alba]